MNTEDMYRCRKIYLIIGFLFGLVFPIIAFVIRAYESNVENAIALMTIDPLLWIICMAPFILGAIAFFAGVKQDKLKIQISQCKLTESELKKANVKVTNTITELEEYNQRLKASQKTEEE
ncbi:MAG: hypothetical protein R3250_07835, partial [Melioribacteraceae bacterium]|nr:hypothetical protein [Melioribacteraceae bacterium]